MASAKALAYEFALFLEGVRIPMMGFDVSFSSATSFNVNMPPANEVLDIQPNTHAFIIYRDRRTSSRWHVMCEGIYTGVSYSKDPNNRTLRLRFRDIQWFLERSKVYELIVPGNTLQTNYFGPLNSIFIGDTRYSDAQLHDDVKPANTQWSAKANFLEELNKAAQEGRSPLAAPIEGLWELFARSNDFNKAHASGFKINKDRLHIIDNPRMGRVFTANLLDQTINRIFGEMTNETNVMDLMLMLFQIIQYDVVPIPGMASSDGSSIRSFVTKPLMMLSTPPACNVVFPSEQVVFNFEINYDLRPTRFWFREVIQNGGITRGYFSPAELREEMEQDPIVPLLLEEERLRGINSQEYRLPWAYTIGVGRSLDEEKYEETSGERINFYAAFANYKYHEQKYFSTPMNVTIAFKPDILPGFPMLILDSIMPMMGYVIGVNHYVDIMAATAYTSVTLSHVRPASTKVPLLAGWYDEEAFSPDNINALYENLGTRAFFSGREPDENMVDEEGFVDYYPAIKRLWDEYQGASEGGKLALERSFKRVTPVFWDEQREDGDVARALSITWSKETDRLEPVDNTPVDGSPFNISYEGKYGGETTTQIRRPPIERLKSKIHSEIQDHKVWKRGLEEGV